VLQHFLSHYISVACNMYGQSQSSKFQLLLTSLALIFVWQPTEQTLTCYSTVVFEFRRFQNIRIYIGMKNRTSRHVLSIPVSYYRNFGAKFPNREAYLPSWTRHIIWHTYVATHIETEDFGVTCDAKIRA